MTHRREFIKRISVVGILTGIAPSWLNAKQADRPFAPNKKRALRIAHVTDVHILDQMNAETCFARVLQEINSLKDKPDLIINTGDTVMDENKQLLETVETRWNVWKRISKNENDIVMKSALGNHDVWYGPDATLDAKYKLDKRYGKQWAIDNLAMPSRYYSFDLNGWKFIALDSINGEDGYQLDEEQFSWLRNELTHARPGQPVCVFSHVPIISMGALLYATKHTPMNDIKFPSADMHNDHQRIKDIFSAAGSVKVCLSGHVHYVDGVDYLGVKYLCNGAVSGNWWRAPLALDEFPPVYSLLDLYEDGTFDHRLVYYNSKV
ncbi:MAG TPA: metallophosphoesterase [Chryseolinea sp.]|nr:metallophosphoesterase [Chryseolinea sp.]